MPSHARIAAKRPPLPVFRNRRGEQVQAAAFTATDAKKQFARILETVLQGGAVVITKHDAPKAILLSVDEFSALTKTADSTLDTLTAEFDGLYTRMQTPKARAGMAAAFAASPEALGRAAVTAARKRG
jgi:prevent-host-death family protein